MGDAVGSFVNDHAHPNTSQQLSKSHVLSPKSYACLIYSKELFVVFTLPSNFQALRIEVC